MTSHPAEAATRENGAPYGHCPICGAQGVSRERRPNGNDKCINGHSYPSKDAIISRPTITEQSLRGALGAPTIGVGGISGWDFYQIYMALKSLSTHQQQGAESAQAALDREFDKAMKEPNQRLSDFEVLWNVAVSLLSRAPQPDTRAGVIEECAKLVETYAAYTASRNGHSGELYMAEGLRIIAENIRALSAKGK